MLKECDAECRIGLKSAAIVERTPEGELRIPEDTDNIALVGTVSGSLNPLHPRTRRAEVGMLPRAAFEGVNLLDTVERLSVPSYAIDRQSIVRWLNTATSSRVLDGHEEEDLDASVSRPVAEHAGRPVLIVSPPR